MRVVVNHLHFREPIPDAVLDAAREVMPRLVEAGGVAAQLVRVDDRHAVLVLTFPDAETEERVKDEIGSPWMREHVVPLLAGPPERASGEVVAGS